MVSSWEMRIPLFAPAGGGSIFLRPEQPFYDRQQPMPVTRGTTGETAFVTDEAYIRDAGRPILSLSWLKPTS